MARKCTVCAHPRRHQIEIGLVHGLATQVLADRFGLKRSAIGRHRDNHLPAQTRAAILSARLPSEIDLEQLQRDESEGLLSSLIAQRARLQSHAEVALNGDDVKAA